MWISRSCYTLLLTFARCKIRVTWLLGAKKISNLWIGDSHASYHMNGKMRAVPVWKKGSEVSLWMGPRLAYSVSQRGLAFARDQKDILARGFMVEKLVATFGEIDCRMYPGLPDKRYRDPHWVEDYCLQVKRLASLIQAHQVIICGPLPPSNFAKFNPNFPTRGQIKLRINGAKWLTETLTAKALLISPGYVVVDLFEIFATTDQTLDRKYSSDGIHLNKRGSERLRQVLDQNPAQRFCSIEQS